jgi:hypothetical protein
MKLAFVPWLRRLVVGLSAWRLGFDARPVCVGFVQDKLAVGQAFLRVLRFVCKHHPVRPHIHISFIYHRHDIALAVFSVLTLNTTPCLSLSLSLSLSMDTGRASGG